MNGVWINALGIPVELQRSVPAVRDVPLEHQVSLLGLNSGALKALKGKIVLDLACGCGSLVNYLRENGVNAQGLDPRAPEADHFMRCSVLGLGDRGIPVGDCSYDAVFSFQNVPLNTAFGSAGDYWLERNASFGEAATRQFSQRCGEAHYMISEIGRVLRPGCKATIYPFLYKLKSNASLTLRAEGLQYAESKVDSHLARKYANWEDRQNHQPEQGESPSLLTRIELKKKKR